MKTFNKIGFLALALMVGMIFGTAKVQGTAIDYDMHGDSFEMTRDTYCMALNIYHESRSENLAGKFAVADVVMNRVNNRRYPDNICSVIYEAEMKPSWKDAEVLVPVRNRCQFSWYCDGKSDEPTETDAWNESVLVAHQAIYEGRMNGLTEGATHYHTTFVNPYWAPTLQQVGTIGSHIFYRQD
jgi:spore germination cell wall hydrolase CwlJ-like protein